MTFPWPKLDGPPTQPGWYFRLYRGHMSIVEVFRNSSGKLETNVQHWSLADLERELPGTWYGPIPPPPTGERKPCSGWKAVDGWGLVLNNKADGRLMATVEWSNAAGAYAAIFRGAVVFRSKDRGAAQLAAEDAINNAALAALHTTGGQK